MLFKLSTAVLAVACVINNVGAWSPPARPSPPTVSQCNTGDAAQCCNTVGKASDVLSGPLAGLLSIFAIPVDAVVGLGCTSISIISVAQGTNCAQQPVCCEDNEFNGVVNIGCSPLAL